MISPVLEANPVNNRSVLVKMCGYGEEVVTA